MSEISVVASEFQGLDEILSAMSEIGSSDLIPIFQGIQRSYGYLPPEVLKQMSRRTGIKELSILHE